METVPIGSSITLAQLQASLTVAADLFSTSRRIAFFRPITRPNLTSRPRLACARRVCAAQSMPTEHVGRQGKARIDHVQIMRQLGLPLNPRRAA